MKSLFKPKPKSPPEVVRLVRNLLANLHSDAPEFRGNKREEKMKELTKLIRDLKSILYGSSESEPVPEACKQLTAEFFKEDSLRLLILCLPKLDLERQYVDSRLLAPAYLEGNLDLLDILVSGYYDPGIALHYGGMLRECIRHQTIARYVVDSEHMNKFFDFIQLPNFDVAADAAATFKELLTRHKSTVADFLSKNFDWFFREYNSRLLGSDNYLTRRQAVKLLGSILLERSNSSVMVRYVSSKENLCLLMNLLRESSKSIQIDAFHVFKLFVANQNKTPEIVKVLVANQTKLLRYLTDFTIDKEDEHFEEDKAQVLREIAQLVL